MSNILIQQDTVAFNIPQQYLNKVIQIMTSGVLDIKGDRATLHFDKDGALRIIEYPHKIFYPE